MIFSSFSILPIHSERQGDITAHSVLRSQGEGSSGPAHRAHLGDSLHQRAPVLTLVLSLSPSILPGNAEMIWFKQFKLFIETLEIAGQHRSGRGFVQDGRRRRLSGREIHADRRLLRHRDDRALPGGPLREGDRSGTGGESGGGCQGKRQGKQHRQCGVPGW